MYRKYLGNAFRHLRRNRLFTMLNITGLAISISACWVIYRLVSYEFSFDSGLKDAHIYRVVTGFNEDGKESYNGGVSKPLYQGLRKDAAGLKCVVPVWSQWLRSVQIPGSKGAPVTFEQPNGVVATDSAYFSMVPYQWLAGNNHTALRSPNQVVLTESRAQKYFPNKRPEEIINQSISYLGYGDTVSRKVTGVVADLPGPTGFSGKEFIALPAKEYSLASWTNTDGGDLLYLQLEPAVAPSRVLASIEQMVSDKSDEFNHKPKDVHPKTANEKPSKWYQLMPLSQSHFATYINEWNVRKANKKVLFGLIGVAVFLLVLACINYINMGVAAIPQRSKEIGVRKTLGSSRSSLIGQFLAETFVTSALASALAFVLAWAEFRLLKDLLPDGLSLSDGFILPLAFALVLCVVVTILSGLYPGWLITKVKTVHVFRHIFVFNSRGGRIGLQKALIVFQFTIAVAFITGAMIVGRQLRYVVDSDMGFNKDAVILAGIPWKYLGNPVFANRQFTLENELRNIPGVNAVSIGQPPLYDGFSSSSFSYLNGSKEPVVRQIYKKDVDTGYLRLYGFHLLAGRNFLPSDTPTEVVINESTMKAFGFASPRDAIGKVINQRSEEGAPPVPIVGVVRDFHMQNFYKTIDPAILESRKENLTTFNIKLENEQVANWPATLKAIEKKWDDFYPPGSFSYSFYDETIEQMYNDERNLSLLIKLATGISIFISCMGLFGLAVLTALQRTKEIGIRKVLGATVGGIVTLLSRDYLRLVAIAILIATPVAWWVTSKWMQNFAYRTTISWWLFCLAGASAVAIAFLTVGFHALKAAKVNPVKSLRTD